MKDLGFMLILLALAASQPASWLGASLSCILGTLFAH